MSKQSYRDLRKILSLLALLLFAVFSVGCFDDESAQSARFYVESSSSGKVGVWSKHLTLPRSGLSYYVEPKPVITEANITNVQLVQVQSGDLALLFYLDENGTRELYRYSVISNGRCLVLVVNGEPIGVRQFDGAISDGRLYTFTELPDSQLSELAVSLQQATIGSQNKQRHHGY